MHVINLGTKINQLSGHELTNTNLFSAATFLDADIIFWDIGLSFEDFRIKTNGVNNIDSNTFFYYKKFIDKRKKEFEEFFNIGRTLVIVNPAFENIAFTLNDNDVAESQNLNIVDCIELGNIDYEEAEGRNIVSIEQQEVKKFTAMHKQRLSYSIKYTSSNGYPLMFIKGTNYSVSKFYKKNNGYIIFLPNFNFLSNTSNEQSEFVESFEMLIQGIKKIPTKENILIPEWVDDYVLANETKEIIELSILEEKQAEIKKMIDSQKDILLRFRELKALFSTDGDTLELTVARILKDIGFIVEKPENNRDDLVIKSNDVVAVVEIKGNTKSAAERHCAQLQKWITNYHLDKGINPKGILIINTYKDKPIYERSKPDFPDQMLTYANQMQHCLISGLQLLCIYLDFKNGKIKKEKVIELLLNTTGELRYTDEIKNYLNLNDSS